MRDPTEVDANEHVVAQRYIPNPYVIDNQKFDLRIYALLYGVNPLRIFVFKDGLVRVATEEYEEPNDGNIDNLYMHLTNYAINKHNENFVQNSGGECSDDEDETGTHKRSLKSMLSQLMYHGKDHKKLKREIRDIIVKTIITAHPSLHHTYKSCQPDDLEGQLCFQILGFDILLDSEAKPYLIEVN